MFEQFTKSARTAVIEARTVAQSCGASHIDSGHLAVALLRSDPEVRSAVGQIDADPDRLADAVTEELGNDLDAEALASVGINLEDVRRRTDAMFGEGALLGRPDPSKSNLPFGKDAKKSLELALREARRFGGRRIDGGHLLLGILRAECPGRTALVTAGVDIERLRRVIEDRDPAS
jgi:ATP-dependent Clp protease ATP-binding subunit ClpA